MVICLERGADLHIAQRIPLLLTVSCFSKIQIGFTFLVPAHPVSPCQMGVYLCQLVFAAILWVKLLEMSVTLLSLKYAFSVG